MSNERNRVKRNIYGDVPSPEVIRKSLAAERRNCQKDTEVLQDQLNAKTIHDRLIAERMEDSAIRRYVSAAEHIHTSKLSNSDKITMSSTLSELLRDKLKTLSYN